VTVAAEADTSPAPRARWGDREGRRRDILGAARDQIAATGYLSLNMRDIARGAGVSPGTLYSYFATKEEIFATLYVEAIEAHNDRLRELCTHADGLVDLIRQLASAYLDLYAAYGRHFTTWSELVDEDAQSGTVLPPELGRELRAAALTQGQIVRDAVVAAADAEGRTVADPDLAASLLWTTFNGLGDHVTSGRHHLSRFSTSELIDGAARTLAAGLTAPAPPPRRRTRSSH
jgi:AcrR family transcriptional regulator